MDAREATGSASSEHHSMMASPNSYNSNLPNSAMCSPASAGMMQTTRLPFNSIVPPVSKPVDNLNSTYHNNNVLPGMRACGFGEGDMLRKKRGRPRKYGPDGTMALALTPLSSASGYSDTQAAELSFKRRGRPPGSGKKQQLNALGYVLDMFQEGRLSSAGIAFTPHIITVKAGEDVASTIMSFSQQGPRAVCILSANGAISNVTLRQPAISGGTVSYEGRFEIISLSGSFLLTESDGTRSRTGGLSVSLAGSDGRVIGGGVAGMLMAATPVQVVVGSFIADGKKPKPDPLKREPTSAPPQMGGFPAPNTGQPLPGSTSESSEDEPSSPLEQRTGAYVNSSQHAQPITALYPGGWAAPHSTNQQRHDMNM
ncbi:hypothetical protein ACLOJK_033988 [Asimina triloba]